MPAVQSIRVIRRKIRSVGNIKKITRAMQMVSAAKLKKVQERLMQLRPYAGKIRELLDGLTSQVAELKHPLFTPHENIKTIGLVVIMAEKGLCGAFNANMIRNVTNFLAERQSAGPVRKNSQLEGFSNGAGANTKIIAIGKKSADYFRRHNFDISAAYTGLPTEVLFAEIQKITKSIVKQFEQGAVDEVHILYTHYVNALKFEPRRVKFLPIEATVESAGVAKKFTTEYIFEPAPEKILERLIPRYVETTFHRILLESMSSEHAARMNSMKNATDNAEELIDSLTLTYNKARQAGITKELLDIVGGAEALK
ncbi:MAG: ATP synthase F1 subunit gamma [Planctomycetes bacterium RBG_16_43_13]|nr:MAG: ATP synthase F1 subunit gamma [Planctomycetes bacterium RBG_16_43_13]